MGVIDILRKLGGCAGGIAIYDTANLAAKASNIGRERKTLKPEIKSRLKLLFPKIDFGRVRFLVDAQLPPNWFKEGVAGMTFGHTIYFKGHDIQKTVGGLELLIHELVHVNQVRARGDSPLVGDKAERQFACDYGKGYLKAGSYEKNPLEKEAYDFAASLNLPVFNSKFYLGQYPDLQRAFGNTNYDSAAAHWILWGINEGRRSSRAFDVSFYLSQHSDLQAAFGSTNYLAAIEHWLQHGIKEGRRSSPAFDVGFYLSQYPDLQKAFGQKGYAAAIDHWLRHGLSEGRRSSREFDVRFYLGKYSDLKTAFGANNFTAAFDHWLQYGMNERRQGAP